MEKNNGKIAIAIVAMFVVALSIVGVTYAYFVATVRTNTTNNNVTVQAGVLKVKYDNGQTMSATGIVPGWKSDNDMVYNSIKSVTTENGETRITAVKYSELTQDEITNGTTTGKTAPITFTVKDESTNNDTAYYGLRLVAVEDPENEGQFLPVNELATDEPDNFLITVTEATAGKVNENYKLTNSNSQKISSPISITGGVTHTYTLTAEYKETGGKQTGTGKNVDFKVEVVGLQLVNTKYLDAEGNEW